MNNAYEGLFIIKPDLKDEETKGLCKAIVDTIGKHGGVIKKEEDWGRRQLGFPIAKSKDGRYYKVDFEAPGEAVGKLEGAYKLNGDILRVMITRR